MTLTFPALSAFETAAVAGALAPVLRAGDTILLYGDVGAGKTHFARAFIQARLAQNGLAEDVPSPTFTLVQTYDAGDIEIWHADLYRLGHEDEVVELGLDDAFRGAICLVEWPARLGHALPPRHINLTLGAVVDPDQRSLTFEFVGTDWAGVIAILERAGAHR